MAMSFTLTYKEEIEALKDEKDFERIGDEKYMYHEDDDARLQWAFYRPSGSHPDQVKDPNVFVSIMAFNHSRLGALERFRLVNPEVLSDEKLRVKIRNRSRMLFRALVDDDFKELIEVLGIAPMFLDLAIDQMNNGRIWNESFADLESASRFIDIVDEAFNETLQKGIKRRLQPIKAFSFDEAKGYLESLVEKRERLHTFIKEHFIFEYTKWIKDTSLHPLQRIALEKKVALISES